MNELDKKIIKKTYILLDKGHTVRDIKKSIKDFYGVSIQQKQILQWFPALKRNHNEMPDSIRKIFLCLYRKYPDNKKIADYMMQYHQYVISPKNMASIAHRYGVKRQHRSLNSSNVSFSQEKEMLKLYKKGVSAKTIASKFGYKTEKSVYDRLNKFGLSPNTYRNDVLFNGKTYGKFSMEKIDSKEKAYFLGLLLTDGSINPERNYVELSLIDEDAIAYLCDYISCDYVKYSYSGQKPFFRILLYGETLVYDLFNKQVKPVKTHSLQGPTLNEDETYFLAYILRGIIDGDGWVQKDGKEFYVCSASYDFILWCNNAFSSLGMKDLNVRKEQSGIYVVRTSKRENMQILKSIYAEEMGMSRKRTKVMKNVQRL